MLFRNRILWLIIIASCVRIIVAQTTELDNDEAYYFTYALHLQWNYFDHPPGVALLIRLSTLNLFFTNQLFVRLGSIICAALGTWLSYCIGKLIRNERTGFFAAVLYNTSIYSSIIAGVFILPDSPQIVFWLAALLLMIKIVIGYEENKTVKFFNWLLFGLLAGLCILCKIHGIFLWIGLGLYALIYKRKIFSDTGIFLSFVLTLVIISPIVFWNINNHFVTYTYHSNRVAVHSLAINISSFLQAIIGQIFYNNPVNVFVIILSILYLKKKKFLQPAVQKLLLLTGMPIIIIVTLISLFNSILPHWSGPGFVTITFIAAAYLDSIFVGNLFQLPQKLKYSIIIVISIVVIAMVLILFYPGTFGSKNKDNYGSGDFTLDMNGWKNFSTEYKQWMYQQTDSDELKNLKIVCDKWFPAAHIEYYVAYPMHSRVIGVGELNDLHNFAWLNRTEDLKKGGDALCIIPSNYNEDVKAIYGNEFSSITPLHVFTTKRNGEPSRFFTLYLLQNYKANDEVHTIKLK